MSKLSNNWSVFSNLLRVGFILSLVLALFWLSKVKDLNTQYSIDQFLPDEHPLLTARDKMEEDFEISRNSPILVLIQFSGESWLNEEKMKSLRDITVRLGDLEDVESVQSLANVESAAEAEDDIAMGGLFELTDPSTWESRVVSDPTLYPLLISKNFDTAVIAITSSKPRSEMMSLLNEIRQLTEEKFQKAKVTMGGVPTIQAQMAVLIGDELKLFLFLALFVACFSLFFVFSSLSSLFIPVIAVFLSVILSVEFMVLARLSFNALSATVMVLVTIIVVALCIHTQLRFCKEVQKLKDKNLALKETFQSLFLPNFLTALTTAVGFMTLCVSPSTLMRQYGVSVAASVFIAWFVTSCFLFGFLNLLPLAKARKWVFSQTERLNFSVSRGKTIITKVFLMAIICLLGSRYISWEAKLFDDLPDKHEARQVSETIDKELGGLMTYDVAITAEDEGFWNEPEALKKIDELERKWRKWNFVESVLSVPELIRQSKNNPEMAIPDERSQIAEIGFMFSLAEKNPLIHFLTPDGSAIRIALRLQDAPATQLDELKLRILTDVKSKFPDLKISSGGMASYAQDLSRYLSRELIQGFWWAMLAICLVLFFVFRSLSWTLLATAPNFLPAIALLGLLGFSGIPVKPAIATIFSIALGIAFDNTVYILSRLRSYNSPIGQKLVKKAIQEEGISCFISSFCLFCGFAIFLMSYFSINRYFGLFLLFSILVGLVGDLLFLPALIGNLPESIKKRLKV